MSQHSISRHISWREATFSATAARLGIPNMPTMEHIGNMRELAEAVFEPLRAWAGGPIGINSFYRSRDLNRAIGGSASSQHCTGQAIDLDMDRIPAARVTNAQLFHHIRQHLPFDQLIWEFGNATNPDWVHVSLAPHNRRQILVARRMPNGRTAYDPWKP